MNVGVGLVHGRLTAMARSPAALLASMGSNGQARRQHGRSHDHNRTDPQANLSGHGDLFHSMPRVWDRRWFEAATVADWSRLAEGWVRADECTSIAHATSGFCPHPQPRKADANHGQG